MSREPRIRLMSSAVLTLRSIAIFYKHVLSQMCLRTNLFATYRIHECRGDVWVRVYVCDVCFVFRDPLFQVLTLQVQLWHRSGTAIGCMQRMHLFSKGKMACTKKPRLKNTVNFNKTMTIGQMLKCLLLLKGDGLRWCGRYV